VRNNQGNAPIAFCIDWVASIQNAFTSQFLSVLVSHATIKLLVQRLAFILTATDTWELKRVYAFCNVLQSTKTVKLYANEQDKFWNSLRYFISQSYSLKSFTVA